MKDLVALAVSFPMLLFAFYGMNIPLPFDRHARTWMWMLGLSVAWVVVVLWLQRGH